MFEDEKKETVVKILSGTPVPDPRSGAQPQGAASAQEPAAQPIASAQEPAAQPIAPPPCVPQEVPESQPYAQQSVTGTPPYASPAPQTPQQQVPQQQAQGGVPYSQQPSVQQSAQGTPLASPPYTQQAVAGSAYGPSPYSQFAQSQYGQPSAPVNRKKEKKEKTRKAASGAVSGGRKNMAALVVVIIIACLASGIGGGMIGAGMNQSAAPGADGGTSLVIEPSGDSITTTVAVAKKALPSVVGITATGTMVSENYFFGRSEEEVTGVGTGMIIDAQGYILTNSHVVMDGAVNSIRVLLADGEEVDGQVIWSDSGLDLAVVKIDAISGLQPVEIGDSDDLPIGSYAAAIGNPLGLEFNGSVTQGIISGLDRSITVSDELNGQVTTMEGLIQVDAAINRGNSGGPLLNSKGQVVGVNTAKAGGEGMGFAIPINTAIPIVEKVIRDGGFERVYLGVSAADVNVIKENYPNVEILADSGACITDINPGSPAEQAGLKVKDVITAIDGKEVSGSTGLIKLLLGYDSGDVVKVDYIRDGEVYTAEVTLLSRTELDKVQVEENPFIEPPHGNSGR